jgi:copper resistance protein B
MPSKLSREGVRAAAVLALLGSAAAAQEPEIDITDLGEFPDSVEDVRDPEGPVTAEELARGNVFVPGEPVHDNPFRIRPLIDRLEVQTREGDEAYVWDTFLIAGWDYNQLWIESEGEGKWGGRTEAADLQVLYTRAVTPYWNLQAGYRRTFAEEPDRDFLVLGAQGLNVYYNGVEANLYLSEDGDVSGDFEIEYDALLTQRLIAEPRFEVRWQAQDVEQYGLGGGFTGMELGVRVRYEFVREFAPYLGVSYRRTLGETADLLPAGANQDDLSFLVGLRAWY